MNPTVEYYLTFGHPKASCVGFKSYSLLLPMCFTANTSICAISSKHAKSHIKSIGFCRSVGFTSVFVFSQVASLRQQLEQLQGGGGGGRWGGGVRGGCGPEAPCGRSLAAMERAHRQALEELQRQHERQMKELETEKNRLLLEETQDTARGQQTSIKT